MKHDVVITGLGVVSPIGTGKEAYAQALQNGISGIDRISLFDASHLSTRFAGEVKGFSPEKILAGTEILSVTRERRLLLANAAAKLAMRDAGLDGKPFDGKRAAVIAGSGVHPVIPDIGQLISSGVYTGMFDDPDPRAEKFSASTHSSQGYENRHYPIVNRTHQGAVSIARQYGISGVCHTIVSACAAATQAIGQSYRLIQRGGADIVITGGYDSMVFGFGLYAFSLLGIMSSRNDDPLKAMRPFDKTRDGFALGEGAGMIVLESREHAQSRGAPIYGQVAGYGSSVDAFKVTDPHPTGQGAVIAMQDAVQDAGIDPCEIDYINAHGTATPKNDKVETMAIKQVFGKSAYHIPVSSTKSMIGHLMAAAGALEFAAMVLCMDRGFVHPTINYEVPDPDCDLDYVPNHPRVARINMALSNSFGLGGQNASIIVKRELKQQT